MSTGGPIGTDFETMRARNWPTIRQFTIFLENRVGQLRELLGNFQGSNIRVVAFSISEFTECAFGRVVVSDPEEGREILARSGLPFVESDLIVVELPDQQQPLLRVCTALLQAEVNIVQAYPLIVRPHGRPAVALMVDNTESAMDTLARLGFSTISEADLSKDDS